MIGLRIAMVTLIVLVGVAIPCFVLVVTTILVGG